MCPLCVFGDDPALAAGVVWAVATMMAVTVGVLGGIARFAIRVWRNQER
jgi:uncharacterized membrane protein YeiH